MNKRTFVPDISEIRLIESFRWTYFRHSLVNI